MGVALKPLPKQTGSIHTLVQAPLYDRYTYFWWKYLVQDLDFRVMGERWGGVVDRSKPYNWFANLEESIAYEYAQIYELFHMDVYEEDFERLLICDLDFPGLAAGAIPALKLKFPKLRVFGILHAGPWCNQDIFRDIHAKDIYDFYSIHTCDLVFVASNYHKDLIETFYGQRFQHLKVLGGMPFDAQEVSEYRQEKTKGVIVLGRKEQTLLRDTNGIEADYHTDLIPREDYLRKLAQYRVAIFPKVEETFGYSVMEAMALQTVPLVPASYAYGEFVPEQFQYGDAFELATKVKQYRDHYETILFQNIDLLKFGRIFDKIKAEVLAWK